MSNRKKNLIKTDNGFVNQFGVKFTEAEKRALQNAVNAANRKRNKMLKEAASLPRMVAGKNSGDTVASLLILKKEPDFILSKKTKSLQRFKNREQFDKYLKALSKTNKPDYIDDRVRMYKRNHMKALENAYGDEAKDVIMKIRMMKPKDYMKMVEQDETLEISYIYDPTARTGKLNQMRGSMGMKLKDEEIDIEDY